MVSKMFAKIWLRVINYSHVKSTEPKKGIILLLILGGFKRLTLRYELW